MSSIGPGIAGSVSQAAAQQADVARARDKVRNRDEQEAQRLRELLETHLYSVENSAQADDDPLRVKDEQRNAQQHRRQREHEQQRKDQTEPTDVAELSNDTASSDPPSAPASPLGPPPPPGRRLDVEA